MARKMLIDGEKGNSNGEDTSYDFDLFVIGAGSGGVRASQFSAQYGAKVKEYRGCKASAIYFTNDYWDRIDEDIYYGGHDLGVFNMGDGSIEPFFDCNQERFEPPSFWVVPN
ncbi:protein of unknown function-containing protein [Forsythia ovata]|uniref:Uncharacterized protein n=1 Tax=Forsythia ovata TaxID=205694 RepID=A0ABD1TNG9_9LAMI